MTASKGQAASLFTLFHVPLHKKKDKHAFFFTHKQMRTTCQGNARATTGFSKQKKKKKHYTHSIKRETKYKRKTSAALGGGKSLAEKAFSQVPVNGTYK